MRSILISIQPKWCELIANGKKTIEVRKTRPKIETPFKCYIYETKARSDMPTFVDEDGHVIYTGRGQVIGEFVCDQIIDIVPIQGGGYVSFGGTLDGTCLSAKELCGYLAGNGGFAWHISDLKIYDKPRESSEFAPYCEYKGERCECCVRFVEVFGGCCNVMKKPPQTWRYVEELENDT